MEELRGGGIERNNIGMITFLRAVELVFITSFGEKKIGDIHSRKCKRYMDIDGVEP